MKLPWWSVLVSFAVGFGLCYWWPSPPVRTVHEVVSVPTYLAARPETLPPRLLTRLVRVVTPAETVTVTRERVDTQRVTRFCATPDTTKPPILPPFSGRYQDGRLQLFATRSDGTGWSAVYAAHAPVEWASRDQDALVTSHRRLPPLVRRVLGLGLCGGLGYGAYRLSGDPAIGFVGGGGCVVGSQLP